MEVGELRSCRWVNDDPGYHVLSPAQQVIQRVTPIDMLNLLRTQ